MRSSTLPALLCACCCGLAAQEPGRSPTPSEQKPATKPAAKPATDPARPATKPARQSEPEPRDPKERFEAFLNAGLLGRLELASKIRALGDDIVANDCLPLLSGERRRLLLVARNLCEGLGDVRYSAREKAEQALVNMGPRLLPILEAMDESPELEVRIRLGRVKAKLRGMGQQDILDHALLARGLAECLAYRPGAAELRALLSGLDHLDARVRVACIRSLGVVLGAGTPDAAPSIATFVQRITKDTKSADLERRNAAVAAIGSLPGRDAETFLEGVFDSEESPTSLRLLALRLLARRLPPARITELARSRPKASLAARAAEYFAAQPPRAIPAPAVRPAGRVAGEAAAATPDAPLVSIELKDQGKLETRLLGLEADSIVCEAPGDYGSLRRLRIPRASVDEIHWPAPEKAEVGAASVTILLKTGTRLRLRSPRLAAGRIRGEALGRSLDVAKSAVRGLLPDPGEARAVGGSRKADQLRLVSAKGKPVRGKLIGLSDEGLSFETEKGETQEHAWDEVSTLLMKLNLGARGNADPGDLNQYVQIDLADGQRLVGFLLDLGPRHVAVASPALGCFAIDPARIASMQLSNSGRALTGFTLVTDYGDSRVIELDGEGRVVWKLEDLFDPVDAELVPTGNILVTEQKDDAVREYDREGNIIWEYTDLRSPVDADRLANGNTLITDPQNNRVIEVSPDKKIVWSFGPKDAKSKVFRPRDADRLPNGNTLICDSDGKRVIEVSPAGKVVWTYGGVTFPVDADRLANGNTLITIRKPQQVIEVSPAGSVVWRLTGLELPWDADRLPDGTTMVAENFAVRVFSKEGRVVRKHEVEWAAEANGY